MTDEPDTAALRQKIELRSSVLTVMCDWRNDAENLKKRDNKLPAEAAIDRIIALFEAELAQARIQGAIDERERFEDELQSVLSEHSKNPDLSPIADLRDVNKFQIRELVTRLAELRTGKEGGRKCLRV